MMTMGDSPTYAVAVFERAVLGYLHPCARKSTGQSQRSYCSAIQRDICHWNVSLIPKSVHYDASVCRSEIMVDEMSILKSIGHQDPVRSSPESSTLKSVPCPPFAIALRNRASNSAYSASREMKGPSSISKDLTFSR